VLGGDDLGDGAVSRKCGQHMNTIHTQIGPTMAERAAETVYPGPGYGFGRVVTVVVTGRDPTGRFPKTVVRRLSVSTHFPGATNEHTQSRTIRVVGWADRPLERISFRS
jgi:hypothetical protein